MRSNEVLKLFYFGLHKDGGIARDFNSILESKAYSVFKIKQVPYYKKRIEKNRFFEYFLTWFRLLFQRNDGLILSAAFYPEGLLAWLAGRKQVVFLHGTEIPKVGVRNLIFNKVLNNAYKVIANSTYTKKAAQSVLKKEKNIDIVYPITTFGQEEAESISQTNNKNEAGNTSFKLLTVSRLVPHKNHELVINVVNRLVEEEHNIEYSIVGKGNNEQKLKQQVKKLNLENNICFHGFVSEQELKSIYRESDLFVMPSKKVANNFEGFGLVFVEAKAFGVPSIGSKIGGISDAIKDQHDGFLINPDSEEELYDLLKKLLDENELLDEFKKECKKRYREVYSPKELMKELDKVLKNDAN